MDQYKGEIANIENTLLTNEVELNTLKAMTKKCIELHYEVRIDLSNEIPSLRGEAIADRTQKLQSYKEEVDILLQKIVDKIGNKMETIFSDYLSEELKNPYRETMEKFLFEKHFGELKDLFLSIDRVL